MAHNLETVKRLTSSVRSKASYEISMNVIRQIAEAGFIAKTGIMVGIGETEEEVRELLHEAKAVGCRMITIGQYLQPTQANIEVQTYVHPDTFALYKQTALELGFESVESGPLVRSSYMAERSFLDSLIERK